MLFLQFLFFGLALFFSLFSLLYLSHFALYHLVVGLGVYLAHLLLEGLQFLAYAFGCFFFGLLFANFAYGIFYLSVALAQQFFGLFLGVSQDGLALLFYFFYARLVFLNAALQVLLVLVNGLALSLPVSLVAHDVLQVFVALNIVASHYIACILYHLFGNACFSGYLDGERRAGLSY